MGDDSRSLAGLRYIGLVRCSDDRQAITSLAAQRELLARYGESQGMTLVAFEELAGVTGSVPGCRTDIDRLVRRKLERDDYDVLLVQLVNRLTRAGGGHGFHIECRFAVVGVRVAFAMENLPAGPLSGVLRAMSYEKAREQTAQQVGRAVQSRSMLVRAGQLITSATAPFGCDRLYTTLDGTPEHVIATSTTASRRSSTRPPAGGSTRSGRPAAGSAATARRRTRTSSSSRATRPRSPWSG